MRAVLPISTHSEVKMSDLSSRILNALDEAVAQEVGARLRQAAQNVPLESGAPALPAHFEESLQRLKTLYARVKVIVSKTFGDGVGDAIPTNSPALEMLDTQASERTARSAVQEREAKHGLARHSEKRAIKKKHGNLRRTRPRTLRRSTIS
jgi:hypothetical protein